MFSEVSSGAKEQNSDHIICNRTFVFLTYLTSGQKLFQKYIINGATIDSVFCNNLNYFLFQSVFTGAGKKIRFEGSLKISVNISVFDLILLLHLLNVLYFLRDKIAIRKNMLLCFIIYKSNDLPYFVTLLDTICRLSLYLLNKMS